MKIKASEVRPNDRLWLNGGLVQVTHVTLYSAEIAVHYMVVGGKSNYRTYRTDQQVEKVLSEKPLVETRWDAEAGQWVVSVIRKNQTVRVDPSETVNSPTVRVEIKQQGEQCSTR